MYAGIWKKPKYEDRFVIEFEYSPEELWGYLDDVCWMHLGVSPLAVFFGAKRREYRHYVLECDLNSVWHLLGLTPFYRRPEFVESLAP